MYCEIYHYSSQLGLVENITSREWAEVEETLAFLSATQPIACFMSGSGSACVGVYATETQAKQVLQLPGKPDGFSCVTKAVPAGLTILERSF